MWANKIQNDKSRNFMGFVVFIIRKAPLPKESGASLWMWGVKEKDMAWANFALYKLCFAENISI